MIWCTFSGQDQITIHSVAAITEGGPPDTNGNQNLQAQIQAAANNGRADRSNIVFMEDPGHNVPMGAIGEDEDLLATNLYNAESDAKIPFAQVSDAWDLAYIGQEAQVAARGAQCLTQAQLENINNQNRRENHPLNCAKLNAAVTPYFDGGLKKMSNSGNYSAMSTRNNNFSNRDMTLKMCIRKTAGDNTCDPKFDSDGVIDPRTRPPAGTEQAATQPVNPIGIPGEIGNVKGDPRLRKHSLRIKRTMTPWEMVRHKAARNAFVTSLHRSLWEASLPSLLQ